MNNIKLGIYKHFKNEKEYRVLGIAKYSETMEDMVLYKPLYDGSPAKLWVRPFAMFFEEVFHEGIKQPRFQFVRKK